MTVSFDIHKLSETETNAKAILEHVAEIKKLQQNAAWNAVSVSVRLDENAASGD